MPRVSLRNIAILAMLIALAVAGYLYHQHQGREEAIRRFAEFPLEPLTEIGTTRTLRILPLLEFHSASPELLTEVGVSYLVETDDHRILYDVGQNTRGLSPSALERNMAALGIELDTIDTVFISHNHLDHVGGLNWQNNNTFSLGGVIIVACGHQPIPNLLRRYDDAFEAPLYGIIGGLHFPVPEGRIKLGPLDVQRRLASGDGLLSPLTMEEVEKQIQLLHSYNPAVIGVSPHDSSDEVIARVRQEFGAAYRDIRVGEAIVIGSGPGAGR